MEGAVLGGKLAAEVIVDKAMGVAPKAEKKIQARYIPPHTHAHTHAHTHTHTHTLTRTHTHKRTHTHTCMREGVDVVGVCGWVGVGGWVGGCALERHYPGCTSLAAA